MNRFLSGDSKSVMERLCATMNAIDSEWITKIKPATKEQIQHLKDLIGFSENKIEIPKVYLDFLEKMGYDDGGLLEKEWDGSSEVNIDAIIEYYDECIKYEEVEFDPKKFLLFLVHWAEANLYLDMSKGDNPAVVYVPDKLFADTFENYLFQMAFKYMYKREYQFIDNSLAFSMNHLDAMLTEKSIFSGTVYERMEYISHIMDNLLFEKAWFSDSIRGCYFGDGIVILVSVYWALGIAIAGNDENKVQQVKNQIASLL